MKFDNALCGFLFASLLLAGCTPKETPAPGAAPSASFTSPAVATASAPSAEPVATVADTLPSHADVAKQVRAEIGKQNYKTELDKLEKELEAP